MKGIVALAGMGVSGVIWYASWQLCKESNMSWIVFAICGSVGFLVSCGITLQKEKEEE
jgi:hypothetical protein